MAFVGIIGMDGGGMDLNSRRTIPMGFEETADWYLKSIEYFTAMVKYDYEGLEVTISLYREEDIYRINAEPITQKRVKA